MGKHSHNNRSILLFLLLPTPGVISPPYFVPHHHQQQQQQVVTISLPLNDAMLLMKKIMMMRMDSVTRTMKKTRHVGWRNSKVSHTLSLKFGVVVGMETIRDTHRDRYQTI